MENLILALLFSLYGVFSYLYGYYNGKKYQKELKNEKIY